MKYALGSLPIIILLASCSGKNPAELYAEGKQAETEKNHALALELYEEAVNDEPAEAYAESSMYRIVMLSTNLGQDRQKAVADQRRFLELYPSSGNAPTVMFMSAFLYNNEIGDLDSAKKYYSIFLEKYPEDELARSARFELDNLGKKPEEYLREKTAATGSADGKNTQ